MFVVDLSQLEKPEDIQANDLGSWVCNGKQCNACEVDQVQFSEHLFNTHLLGIHNVLSQNHMVTLGHCYLLFVLHLAIEKIMQEVT